MGAKTGQGFGQVILEEIELYIFDYSKKKILLPGFVMIISTIKRY